MTPERWKRVEDLFDSASQLAHAEREAFLLRACGDDAEVRREVLSLLETDAAATRFLETPVLELSAALPAAIAAGAVIPDALVGATVGDYRVERRLGTGGMGVVYLARQLNPSRVVALKLIRPGLASANLLKRFEHEAQVLGRLHHVGIAQIYEAGTAQTPLGVQPFFAMEYVVGEPLLEYASSRNLNVRARLALVARVCDAVQHAHNKGVIHRDIKPGNILVEEGDAESDTGTGEAPTAYRRSSADWMQPDGGRWHEGHGAQPKILDFGVSRVTDADPQNVTMRTEVGQLVGTLAYMSPEQVAPPPPGGDSIDTRSDVYALGVVAYQLVTGRLPHEVGGKALHEAARAICETPAVRPSVHNGEVRGDVETVILKALEKNPSRRYQSAAALGDDLRRVLSNQPILARPASASYQLRKLIERHRVASAALAAILLLLVGFGVWMSVLYARADRLRHDAEQAWGAEAEAHRKADESQRLATRRAETAGKMVGVLVDAFRAVDPVLSGSEDVNARDVVAREIVDRGLRKIERELGDEPRIRAQLLASLGATLVGLGNYERAVALLKEAIELRRAEARGDGEAAPLAMAQYLESMSQALQLLGRDEEAIKAESEAIEIFRAHLPAEAPEIASAFSTMAYLHVLTGDIDTAEKLVMESMRMHDKTPGHAGTVGIEALNVLGGLLTERGEYERAAGVLRRAMERLVISGRGSTQLDAALHSNLAWVLCMGGKPGEAEPSARQALEARLKQFPAGHYRTTYPMLTLGLILTRSDRATEGEGHIRKVIEIRKAAAPDNFGAIGEAESALGECLCAQGKFDQAESILLSSLKAVQNDSEPSLETVQLALQRLVWLYERMGNEDKAGEYRSLLRSPWDGPWKAAASEMESR